MVWSRNAYRSLIEDSTLPSRVSKGAFYPYWTKSKTFTVHDPNQHLNLSLRDYQNLGRCFTLVKVLGVWHLVSEPRFTSQIKYEHYVCYVWFKCILLLKWGINNLRLRACSLEEYSTYTRSYLLQLAPT